MSRIQAAPVSKLIQGRRTDSGLHRMTKIAQSRSAFSMENNHSSPAAMLSVSDDTNTLTRPRKSRLSTIFRRSAIPRSSEIWLTKRRFFISPDNFTSSSEKKPFDLGHSAKHVCDFSRVIRNNEGVSGHKSASRRSPLDPAN